MSDTTRRPRWRRALRLAGLAAALVVLWLVALWPPPGWYRSHFPEQTAFMAMRQRQGDGKGRVLYQPVPLSQIAPAMRAAVLVSEDHRFYVHGGIDYQAIREALGYRRDDFIWANPRDRLELRRAMGNAWARRGKIRGASTITQQLAKNLYLSPSRNPLRKVKEALTAWRLESALEKDRILELYLNVVEFGPGIWGIEAASRTYFGKAARRLTDSEAALLAATLPSPLKANPALRVGRIRWRQQLILRRMHGESIVVPPPDEVDSILPLPDSIP